MTFADDILLRDMIELSRQQQYDLFRTRRDVKSASERNLNDDEVDELETPCSSRSKG